MRMTHIQKHMKLNIRCDLCSQSIAAICPFRKKIIKKVRKVFSQHLFFQFNFLKYFMLGFHPPCIISASTHERMESPLWDWNPQW